MDQQPARTLPPLGPRAARFAGAGWRLIAVAALLLALSGLWRGWTANYRIDPAFAALGLVVDAEDASRIMVRSRGDRATGVPENDVRLIAIDGIAVTGGEGAAARLAGREGPVRLTIAALGARVDALAGQVAALASAGGASSARTSSMKRRTEIGLET